MSIIHDARKVGLPDTSRATLILSLFILVSILPLFFTGAGASTDSRQAWSVVIEQVPTLWEDQAYIFTASVHGAPNDTVQGFSFSWDFGDQYSNTTNPDKVVQNGALSAGHTYTRLGIYTVGLSVSDSAGNISSASTKATVVNVVPRPDVKIERRSTFEDEPITFDASGTQDSPSDLAGLLFSWALDSEQASSFSSSKSMVRTYPQAGTHTVTLRVKDEHGVEVAKVMDFTVDDQPPLAIVSETTTASEGKAVQFDGRASVDTPSDMSKLTYSWDFGDGTVGTGPQPTHIFNGSGRFTVRLTVTDDDGASTWDQVIVTVQDSPPVAKASVTQVAGSDFVVLDASGSTDSPADTPYLIYDWKFDNQGLATGKVVTHRFGSIGDHTVHLTVTDPSGQTGETDIPVTVTAKTPTINIQPVDQVWEDAMTLLKADIVRDASEPYVYYQWEYDGIAESDWRMTNESKTEQFHYFHDTDVHKLRISVRGSNGAVAFDEITIQVLDVTPKADFTGEWLVLAGKGTTFDASESKDTVTDVPSLEYDWSFGDGTEGNGKVVDHVFASAGDHTVLLTVTDQHGLKGTIKKVITVVAGDLLARVGDKILTIDYSVSDLVDGTPGILPGEVIRVTGSVGLVPAWDGPDLLSSRSATVTVHVSGLNETWETTTARDGTFSVNAIAPFKVGKFDVRVVATMAPFSAEATSHHEVQTEQTAAGPVSMPLVAGAATATAGLIAIGAFGGTDLGRYKFFTLLIPLFTRLKRPRILDHFERGRIYEHIRKTPGDSYSSIRKALGLKNGALAHHLRVLEAHEYIISRRDGMYRRFYPKGMKIPEGRHKSIQEQLLEMIMANPKITQREIAEHMGIDRSTVNYHIKILMAMGVIRSEKDGKIKYYYFVGIKEPLPYEG